MNICLMESQAIKKTGGVFTCPKCDFKTYYKDCLYVHKRAKHEGKVFYCSECAFQCRYQSGIYHHKMSKHEGRRYRCNICNYTSMAKKDTKKHVQAKHESITYQCEDCSYEGNCESNLIRHKEANHKGMVFKCDKCNYTALYRETLKSHSQTIHEGIFHTCDQCKFTTQWQTGLIRHKRIHSRIQVEVKHSSEQTEPGGPNRCEYCGLISSSEKSWKIHVRKRHKEQEIVAVRNVLQKSKFAEAQTYLKSKIPLWSKNGMINGIQLKAELLKIGWKLQGPNQMPIYNDVAIQIKKS